MLCSKAGSIASGTVHLTAHHLIFHYDDPAKEEMWVSHPLVSLRVSDEHNYQIPYPLISLVTRLPLTLQGSCPLTIRTRTFEAASLLFGSEREAIDVFDSVKELTVASTSLDFVLRTNSRDDCSVCDAAVCVLLCAEPTVYCQQRLVLIFCPGRIWPNGRWIAHESMEVHGY